MDFKYNIYSEYLKAKYGQKVYKIPINIKATCPNRDGKLDNKGCIFCGCDGSGHESLSNTFSVKDQIKINIEKIEKKYKAHKFIAYFQNFTNTYIPLEEFKKYIIEACQENIVEIAISTRPDCINNDYLEFLQQLNIQRNINISIELGLQTVNYHTLSILNRGHGLGEFIDAALRIKSFGLEVCTHVILDLPWDNEMDIVECAKIISALGVNQVKIHSLYIVKDTALEEMYKSGQINFLSKDEYIRRVVLFLEYLDPSIIIQRLVGRAPEELSKNINWNTSWWKIKDEIDALLEKNKTFQGKKFAYLNGNILKDLI